MKLKIVLPVLLGIFVLGFFGFEDAFAETLIVASGEQTTSHFSKVNVATGQDIQFLGNSGAEFSGIDFSLDGKLYAASGGGHDFPGLYELSVTLNSGTSAATPTMVAPGLACSDISFSSSGLLYCLTNGNSDFTRKSLVSHDIDSGVSTFIGSTGFGGSSTGNAIAVAPNGIIYFGNDDGLYTLNPVNGVPTSVREWVPDASNTDCLRLFDGSFRGQTTGMDFDSSGNLYASFQCSFDPYLGKINISDGTVTILGPLHSDHPVYEASPFSLGDMKTDALAFAPFDFDFLVGSTFGTVDVVENVDVVPNGDGVSISSTIPVTVDLCDTSSLAMGIDTSFNAECGSVTIQVVTGTVVAEFYADDGSIATTTLFEGDDVFFDEEVFSITNNGPDTVQVIVNGEEPPRDILPGETILLGEPSPPPTTDENDHYLGYKAKQPKGDDKFEKFTVFLDDQFESARYIVEKTDRLYNPVQKWHSGTTTEITDFESHYVGYKIKTSKGDEKFEKRTNVQVTNQFGDIVVDVKKAKLLLVPSAKSHTEVPDVLDNPVNHYKCYDTKVTKHTPKFEKLVVSLYDPNFEITEDFEVKKLKYLCTPVQKTLEDGSVTPITDDVNHLLCYDVKKLKGADKFEKRNVFTNNQFGSEELKVDKQEELCVPSIKILP